MQAVIYIKSFRSFNRIITRELGQYHGSWCPVPFIAKTQITIVFKMYRNQVLILHGKYVDYMHISSVKKWSEMHALVSLVSLHWCHSEWINHRRLDC